MDILTIRCIVTASPAITSLRRCTEHPPPRLPPLRRQPSFLAADSSYPVPEISPSTFVAVVAAMARGMAVARVVAVAVSVAVAVAW